MDPGPPTSLWTRLFSPQMELEPGPEPPSLPLWTHSPEMEPEPTGPTTLTTTEDLPPPLSPLHPPPRFSFRDLFQPRPQPPPPDLPPPEDLPPPLSPPTQTVPNAQTRRDDNPFVKPGCDKQCRGITMDSETSLYTHGRRLTRLLPRELMHVQREPVGDETRSRFVTEYLSSKAYASNNERVVIVSDIWPTINRVVGQMVVSPENGHFAIYDISSNMCILKATPYTVTKCNDYDGKDEYTLKYSAVAGGAQLVDVQFGSSYWIRRDEHTNKYFTFCEMQLFDFIPYSALVSWMPDEAYAQTIRRYGELDELVGRHRKSKDFPNKTFRGSDAFLAKIADTLPIYGKTVTMLFCQVQDSPLAKDKPKNTGTLKEFFDWALPRRFSVALFGTMAADIGLTRPPGHTICVVVETSDDEVVVKVFDSNGEFWDSEFIGNLIEVYLTRPWVQTKKVRITKSKVAVQARIGERVSKNFRPDRETVEPRCNTWAMMFAVNIARFHGTLEPEQIIGEFFRLTPEAAYHLMCLFAMYVVGVAEGVIQPRVPEPIKVKIEPVPSPNTASTAVDVNVDVEEKCELEKPREK